MKLSPEVCLTPGDNRLDLRDDPDYDPNPIRIAWVCIRLLLEMYLGVKDQSVKFWACPEYGLQSLNSAEVCSPDCLSSHYIII